MRISDWSSDVCSSDLIFTSRPAGPAMVTTIWTASSTWTLTALPLFIWMGEILFRTRLSQDLFRGLSPWLGRLDLKSVVEGRSLSVRVDLGCSYIFNKNISIKNIVVAFNLYEKM